MPSQTKTLTSGSVVLLLIAASYLFAIRSEMHLYSFEPRYLHQLSISAAISKLKYGLPGYLGYNAVLKILEPAFDNVADNYYEVNIQLNKYIAAATEPTTDARHSYAGHSGTHTLQSLIGPGLVNYYILSFLLFGYQFQSLLYFYFLLLAIQSIIFFLQFRTEEHFKVVLLLFLVAHYMTLTALRFPGNQLDAPNNYRFLPVLAILPMLHICLLSLYRHRVNTLTIAGALAQALLLAFIIQCRTSAYWTLAPIALLAVRGLYLLTRKTKLMTLEEMNAPPVEHGSLRSLAQRWWPVLVAFSVVFSVGSFYRSQLAPVYATDPSQAAHTFWHPIFNGLALHPDIRLEYTGLTPNKFYFRLTPDGLAPDDNRTDRGFVEKIKQNLSWITIQGHANDQFSILAVARRYVAVGKSPNDVFGEKAQLNFDSIDFDWGGFQATAYDHEVGKLVLDVVLKHPILVLEQVFIAKPVLFTWYYLTCYVPFQYECAFWGGRNTHFTEPLSLSVIFIGLTIAVTVSRNSSNNTMFGVLGILLLSFWGSLIPSLLIYPEPWIIGDAVVVLTMCQLYFVLLFFRAVLNKAFAPQAASRLKTQERK